MEARRAHNPKAASSSLAPAIREVQPPFFIMAAHFENDWGELLAPEFQKDYYLRLREFLIDEYRTHTVYPDKHDIFNALHATAYKDVKAVILGHFGTGSVPRSGTSARTVFFGKARRAGAAVAAQHFQRVEQRFGIFNPEPRLPAAVGGGRGAASEYRSDSPRRRAQLTQKRRLDSVYRPDYFLIKCPRKTGCVYFMGAQCRRETGIDYQSDPRRSDGASSESPFSFFRIFRQPSVFQNQRNFNPLGQRTDRLAAAAGFGNPSLNPLLTNTLICIIIQSGSGLYVKQMENTI